MRISINRNDPGFHPDALDFDIRITLDGETVHNCVTADSDTNELVVSGHPIAGVTVDYYQLPTPVDSWKLYHYQGGKVEIIENGTERRL